MYDRIFWNVPGTISPPRDILQHNADSLIHILLANLNLVVPVAAAILVIIIAIIVVCALKGKNSQAKGEHRLVCRDHRAA